MLASPTGARQTDSDRCIPVVVRGETATARVTLDFSPISFLLDAAEFIGFIAFERVRWIHHGLLEHLVLE